MVIEVVTSAQRNLIEEEFHVRKGTDRHAALADFSFGKRMVGVVAHERGEIEGYGQARLSLCEEVAEAAIGVFGGAEAGELSHGPEARAIHRRVNAARVGRLAWGAEIALRVPIGHIGLRVENADGMAGDRGELCGAFG